ncbi:MAG: ribonuclease HII [Acidobacteriota bacterium]|nr:ribonuclease HII [Acidobacteriota bacterium]
MRSDRLSPRQREALRRRERALRRAGFDRVAGADEAGAGPLAGPLVAAAVILPRRARLPGVVDSKQMSPAGRALWAERIRTCATSWATAEVPAARVDVVGPLRASIEALTAAVRALDPGPNFLLVDARWLPDVAVPQEAVIKGDARHLSIAAASVLAKDHRDRLMTDLDRRHPGYGFADHKGYGTAGHLGALARLGPCPEHRRSYAPVARVAAAQERLF